MSCASGSGVPPPSGVVQNSALSFVASAQSMRNSLENLQAPLDSNLQETSGDETTQAVPLGLKALCEACCKLYPDQPNPLQVTTRLKYWLGGEDPLDYISMYWNPGKPEQHIPPHWHYISFGLSDLHGDGRVHPPGSGSGYGFELSCRVEGGARQPPLWPAQLCQALARYVFQTGNKLCAGDHISWHRPLGGGAAGGGRLRHLLVAPDPALAPVHTPHGRVEFLQLVGCTGRELRAAQRGSGFQVLNHIASDPKCGGPWLVTRPRRRRSARLGRPPAAPAHSPLAGVSAGVSWAPLQGAVEQQRARLPAPLQQQIEDTLRRGLTAMSTSSLQQDDPGKMSTDSFEMSSIERALPDIPDTLNLFQGSYGEESVKYFEAVHIVMNAEGASLLPLALDGRVRMGAHFTWRCGCVAVTLAATRVRGAAASTKDPVAAKGHWLQVVVPEAQARELSAMAAAARLSSLAAQDSETDSGGEGGETPPSPPALPLTLTCPPLVITVLPDHHFL